MFSKLCSGSLILLIGLKFPTVLCQSSIANASSWEVEQHASNNFSFYTIPSNFSEELAPGSLLHPYTPLPPFNSTKQGYSQVAWAHGTSGLFRACAPSNYRNLQYHLMAPFLLELQGMAVVAPDYAGLGFDFLPSGEPINHPWLTGPAQANDLANAIIAARAAFPHLLHPEGRFVAVGHSEGGGAPVAGYKGAVAIAPPTRIFKHLENALANSSEPWAPVVISGQPKLISAMTAPFPSYNYSGLTLVSSDLWFNVLKPLQGCLPTDSVVFGNVTGNDLARGGWTNDNVVQRFARLAETGRKRFSGPLLVLAGEKDIVVTQASTESAVDDTCALTTRDGWQESLDLVAYSDMNHFPVIQASKFDWLPWVKESLEGKPVNPSGCTKRIVKGFRTQYTPQTGTPNFLAEWASPQEAWKYTL
ncbi:putative secretory lipase [Bisporella sp. PMI_857]|nr:putative secretory lipase [Bisporella sp. PMI_857]